jgi:hypothetical protein
VASLALDGSPGAATLTLADVGGGTGHVAADVSAASCNLPLCQVTVVEPSVAMAAKAEERGLRTEVADAVAWARGGDEREAFDRVLFKEVRGAVADCAFVDPFDSSPPCSPSIYPPIIISICMYI